MNRYREAMVFIIKNSKTSGLGFFKDVLSFLLKKIRWKCFACYAGGIAAAQYSLSGDCIKYTDLYDGNLENDICKIKSNERKILFYNTNEYIKDIKYGWEQDRGHHLPLLAAGAGNSHEILKYIQGLTERNKDFFCNKNAMEASIHLINIIVSIRQADERLLYESNIVGRHLRSCLTYILGNPEFGIRYSANHYFFDLLGILWLINSLQNKTKFRRLKGYILKELRRLMGQMIGEDGALYEGSTYYHRYVTESFLLFLYFNREMRDREFLDYAKRMYDFCVNASVGNSMYGFGDNDSGRLLALPAYFEYSGRDISLIHVLCRLLNIEKKEKKSCYYAPYFGLACLNQEKAAVSIRCDEIRDREKNKWIGVHQHNDQLSVEIAFRGLLFFINAGTYLYIADNRNRLGNLKTDRNNTVAIEELEQNTIQNNWQYCERKCAARLLDLCNDRVSALFQYDTGYIHRRTITICNANKIVIEDGIARDGGHANSKVYARFFVSPDTKIEKNKNHLQLIKEGVKARFQADVPIEVIDCNISPEYGMRIASHMIALAMPEDRSTVTLSFI